MKHSLSGDKPQKPALRWLRSWGWLPVLVLCWETLRRVGQVSPLLMPSIGDISMAFLKGLAGGGMGRRWAYSILLVTTGMASGVLLALLAVLAGRLGRRIRGLFSLLSSLLHPLPGLAILPLIILWFGTGFGAILAIMIHAVLWPVYVNLEAGIKSLPEPWKLYPRNLGMGRLDIFLNVELPGSFPYMVSGIRTAWARSWRSFIAAEMVFGAVGGNGGLGWELFQSRVMMDTTALYAALLAVMLTGLLVDETLLNRWEKRSRRKWGEV